MRLWPARQRQDDSLVDDPIYPLVSAFWSQFGPDSPTGVFWSPRLVDRLWVANRCMQLTADMISTMPLRFFGAYEPAWVSNPDPNWFPNGIGDAVFAATWHQLAWGDSFLLITDRYASGMPAAWTVLDPSTMNVQVENGRRVYHDRQVELNPEDVIQVSRDPRGGLRGTSVLQAYASQAWGLLAASELGRAIVSNGGVPNAVLKSTKKLTSEQAQAVQAQWVAARSRSTMGAPAVLPPELDFTQLSFNAQDLALLELQEFNAKVIASAFGVPSLMLNLEQRGSLVYQNPEMLFEVWWRSALRPLAGRIQRALSANMLPRGSWVEFDAGKVLAPSFQDDVTAKLALLKEGVMTVDEVRADVLHLPPLAEGEALAELTEPPTAAASPAQQPSAVVQELRPTVMTGTAP
jgi:HK97 family phage portal protein